MDTFLQRNTKKSCIVVVKYMVYYLEATMIDKIYILKKQKLMYGPYTLQKLKEKGLKPSDMVWYEGLNDWMPAEKVNFLSDFLIEEKTSKTRKKTLLEKVFRFLN